MKNAIQFLVLSLRPHDFSEWYYYLLKEFPRYILFSIFYLTFLFVVKLIYFISFSRDVIRFVLQQLFPFRLSSMKCCYKLYCQVYCWEICRHGHNVIPRLLLEFSHTMPYVLENEGSCCCPTVSPLSYFLG